MTRAHTRENNVILTLSAFKVFSEISIFANKDISLIWIVEILYAFITFSKNNSHLIRVIDIDYLRTLYLRDIQAPKQERSLGRCENFSKNKKCSEILQLGTLSLFDYLSWQFFHLHSSPLLHKPKNINLLLYRVGDKRWFKYNIICVPSFSHIIMSMKHTIVHTITINVKNNNLCF